MEQLEKMRVNLDLQISNSSIAALEGGLPGQRIRLQHAGLIAQLSALIKQSFFRRLTRVAGDQNGRLPGVFETLE